MRKSPKSIAEKDEAVVQFMREVGPFDALSSAGHRDQPLAKLSTEGPVQKVNGKPLPAIKAKPKAKKPTPEQVKARSLAAYKAHLTRQNNALEAAKEPADKTLARKAIKAIKANMSALA